MAGLKRQKRKHTEDARGATADSVDTAENAPGIPEVDVPFTVHLIAPNQPQPSQKSKKAVAKSNNGGKQGSNGAVQASTPKQKLEQSRFDSNLSLSYTIQGTKNPKDNMKADWDGPEMNSFASFQGMFDATPQRRAFHLTSTIAFDVHYKVGELVYVKASDTEAPGKSDGTEYDYDDCWIAQILQIKALDRNHVYVRIFWMYRPDDLPGGRQEYHGNGEFLPSNDMQIINAETVNGKPQEWQSIDETNLSDCVGGYKDLFYRQTYNALTRHTTPALRKICECNEPMDLDFPPLKCANSKCESWLHPSCIRKDIFQRVAQNRQTNKKAKSKSKTPDDTHDTNPDDDQMSDSPLWHIPLTPTEPQKATSKTAKPKNGLKGHKRKRDSDSTLDPQRVRVSFIPNDDGQSLLSIGRSSADSTRAGASTLTEKMRARLGFAKADGSSAKSKSIPARPLLAQVKIFKRAISPDDDDETGASAHKSRKLTNRKGKNGKKGDEEEENGVVEVYYEELQCVECGENLGRQLEHCFLDPVREDD